MKKRVFTILLSFILLFRTLFVPVVLLLLTPTTPAKTRHLDDDEDDD